MGIGNIRIKMAVLGTVALSLMLTVMHPAKAATTYSPAWSSVDQHPPAPDWFQDAKFGIYFHWGAFSVPAFQSEWYPRLMYQSGSSSNLHHIATYGDPSVWPYQNFLTGALDKNGNWTQFAPKLKSAGGNFDPKEWAQLFADAGAQFAGPVAEHHDGFSMWDSKANEWNSVQLGPKLDLLGLFATAIRSTTTITGNPMKLLAALHHAYNFNGYYQYAPAQTDPSLQKLYGQLPVDQENQLWYDELQEVIDQYQPDIIWQDFDLSKVAESQRLNFLSYYYNKAIDWNKEVVATYKDGFDTNGEVYDFERGGPGGLLPTYWLTDDSISTSSWSYTNTISYYTTQQLLHSLIDRVSKNGNMLLNIAPMADGTIPQAQKDILLGMGDWLKRFGEAIYSTRAWTVYGEGPTPMGGGSYTGPVAGTAQDIRFTRSKDDHTLYAIVLGWPGSQLNITTLSSLRINLSTLTNVELLGDTAGTTISLPTHSQSLNGFSITMPSTQPFAADAYVVKLTFSGSIPAVSVPVGPTFYSNTNETGNQAMLPIGSYTTAELKAQGLADNSISSIQVPDGYKVVAYDGDNFTGTAWSFTSSNSSLVATGNNDKISSIQVMFDPAVYFKVVNRTNGMSVNSNNLTAGSNVKQYTWNGSTNLQWQVVDLGNGYCKIVNRTNGLVIDGDGNVASGSYVTQTDWTGSNDQQWQVVDVYGGYYKLVNRTNGLVLDSGGNVPAGSYVKEFSWNGSPNLQWQIVKVGSVTP